MPFKKPAVLLSMLICSLNMRAQTADEILSKYITFTGGEKQWKTVHTIVTSGIYNYGGIEFPFTAYSKSPDLYKFVVPFNGKYYAQAFNGKTGWKIDAFKNQTTRTLLTGKAAKAMANEADVELESPFINYRQKNYQAVSDGKDTVEQKECFKIKFTRENGEVERYCFDMNDYSLLKKEAISKNEEMDNKLLTTFYRDYRKINGIRVPFELISKSGDQTILTITVKKTKVNVPIPDADFQ